MLCRDNCHDAYIMLCRAFSVGLIVMHLCDGRRYKGVAGYYHYYYLLKYMIIKKSIVYLEL